MEESSSAVRVEAVALLVVLVRDDVLEGGGREVDLDFRL